jgi:hypothetical protein
MTNRFTGLPYRSLYSSTGSVGVVDQDSLTSWWLESERGRTWTVTGVGALTS